MPLYEILDHGQWVQLACQFSPEGRGQMTLLSACQRKKYDKPVGDWFAR